MERLVSLNSVVAFVDDRAATAPVFGAVDWELIPSRVKPMTLKLVSTA